MTRNGQQRRRKTLPRAPGAIAPPVVRAAARVEWEEPVADWLRWLQSGRKPGTVKDSRSRIGLVRRWAEAQIDPDTGRGLALSEFKARHLARFLAERQEAGLKDTSRRHDAIVAKAFLKWAFQEQYLTSNPLMGYQIPKAQKAHVPCPSREDVDALFRATAERWNPTKNPGCRFTFEKGRRFYAARDYAIFAGLVATAMRIGEMLSLRLEDCQIARRQVVLTQTKGGEPRILPLSDSWRAALEVYLRRRPKCDNPYLFVTADGGSFGPDGKPRAIPLTSFENNFHHYMKFAALEGKWTLHGLRHYALTHMAKQNLLMASQMAGHKDLKITRAYLHKDADWLREAYESSDPLAAILVNTRSVKGRRKIL